MPVGGIRHHSGPPRGLAQHDRVRPAGLRQRDAGLEQSPPQIAVPIGAARRWFCAFVCHGESHVDSVHFLCHGLWTMSTLWHRNRSRSRAGVSHWGKERRMLVQPYLMFGGRCQEAVDFYRDVLGAEVQMLMRFKEAPESPPPGMMPDNWGDKVMHACLKIGDTQVHGLGRLLHQRSRLQRLLADADGCQRSGSRRQVCRAVRPRPGHDAAQQDVLRAAFRHGGRPLRHRLDGDRAGGGTWPARRRRPATPAQYSKIGDGALDRPDAPTAKSSAPSPQWASERVRLPCAPTPWPWR